MKKKRILYLWGTALALMALVLFLSFAFIAAKDRSFSEMENRNLQQFPALSADSFVTGRFESSFETYVSDQFPFRDSWVRLNGLMQQMLGKREINGIFLGKDGYLIQNFTMPDETLTENTVRAVTAFASRHPEMPMYVLVAPSALTVCENLLPAGAPAGDENGYVDRLRRELKADNLRFVDVREALQTLNETEQVYYRTDHHWTTPAAYAAYCEFRTAAGLKGGPATYDRRLVSDSFHGTLTAMCGCRTEETDEIIVFVPQNENLNRVVSYPAEGVSSVSFYDTAKLGTRDQYALFFGGNHPLVKIETDSSAEKTLLVFKDSYANCFVPFLTADYSEIVMVDPRYFTDELEPLIAAEGIDEVLFLYNANTLSTDRSLAADLQ